ncbi:MAG: DUF2851 family protein [bacterium]
MPPAPPPEGGSPSALPHEDLLQLVWSEQRFRQDALQTTEGQPLLIEFPGWRVSSGGPDFTEARVVLGSSEDAVALFGAVEVHWRSSGWYAHRHHENPAYNSVVLHVVLYQDSAREIRREDGRVVPQLELAPLLGEPLPELAEQGRSEASAAPWRQRLEVQDELPGRCGVMLASETALRRVVAHAAEQRLLAKAEALRVRWPQQPEEELLFQQLFKALGQTAHAAAFEELAQLYPLRVLEQTIRQPWRSSRPQVLSSWFGALGLLDRIPEEPKNPDPTLRRELLHWKALWEDRPERSRVQAPRQKRYRPQHAPERRLLAMYHHLQCTSSTGLLRTWLELLIHLNPDDPQLRQEALRRTELLWEAPEWEIWKSCWHAGTSPHSRGLSLMGADRLLVLWANALLPFFLAYARRHEDRALEQLLFRIFMALPGEAVNQKIRFMQHRLSLSRFPQARFNSLGGRQGLLQLHRDFCHNFHQGCGRCGLPELLEEPELS